MQESTHARGCRQVVLDDSTVARLHALSPTAMLALRVWRPPPACPPTALARAYGARLQPRCHRSGPRLARREDASGAGDDGFPTTVPQVLQPVVVRQDSDLESRKIGRLRAGTKLRAVQSDIHMSLHQGAAWRLRVMLPSARQDQPPCCASPPPGRRALFPQEGQMRARRRALSSRCGAAQMGKRLPCHGWISLRSTKGTHLLAFETCTCHLSRRKSALEPAVAGTRQHCRMGQRVSQSCLRTMAGKTMTLSRDGLVWCL